MRYKVTEEIITGGSARKFYRILKDGKTYILVEDEKIAGYIKILNHLSGAGVAVPALLEVKDNQAIVEDLGRNSLYELVKAKCKNWIDFYRMAIAELVKLQIDGYPNAPVNRIYDYAHIKWEQDYFKQFFLSQFCKIPMRNLKVIENDFQDLAQKVIDGMKPISNFLMHRDYQSQNIYIKNNRARIIDFQSARIGPLSYDLASLLRDAYVRISAQTENELIEYYLCCLAEKKIWFDKEKFFRIYGLTSIQRNMQALGAFVNLFLNKGKVQFKKHIPNGLRLLKRGLKNSEFQKIFQIVNKFDFSNLPIREND